MPQPSTFVRHYANLVWLLLHRPADLDEQKSALRGALSQTLTGAHEVVLTDLNISVAEGAHVRPAPVDAAWISELALRMAGHSVRSLSFEKGATAGDCLNLARALTRPRVTGDEGVAFDATVVGLRLQTIHVHLGRGGFVRRATPLGGVATVGPARTPPLGSRAQGAPARSWTARTGDLGATASLQPLASDREKSTTVGAGERSLADETPLMATAVAVTMVSRDLEQLLSRMAEPLDSVAAAKRMEDAVRTAEQRANQGLWTDVLDILSALQAREAHETDPGVKRAVVLAARRLSKPVILRGVAQLLPRRREVREQATSVLAHHGDTGSDVLIDLLVTTESAPERRTYRAALAQCPSAVPALIHLLGDLRWYVIRNAAELLGEMGVTAADGKLAVVARHADARVRRAAVSALGRMPTPRAVHALQLSLADATPAVRLQAAAGLGAIGNPRAVPAVIKALDREEDVDVQAALLGALGSMPTPDAVERLRRAAEPGGLMHRKPVSVRLLAMQALAHAGTPTAQRVLRALATDRDRDVQAKVDRLLAPGAP